MKTGKRILTLAAALCMVMGCLSGCTKKETAESILEACQENMAKVESYKGDYSLEMKMQMDSADTDVGIENVEVSLECDYEVTSDPLVFHQKGKVGVLGFYMELENYVTQDSAGNLVSYSNMLGKWEKDTSSTDDLAELLNMEQLLEEKQEYVLAEELETVNGKEVYVLTTSVAASEMLDIINDLSGDLEGIEGIDGELSDTSYDIIMKIYKDSKLLAECSASLSDVKEDNDDSAMDLDVSFTIRINEYNAVDTIQIPDEALNAEESQGSTDIFSDYMEEDDSTESDSESSKQNSDHSLDGDWINLDNMQFMINGNVYTLGQTTLQELIDDGVPFNEDDLANAQNNLNKNSESQGFKIILGEYYSAQVFAMNDTDENKTIAECYISEVYLPVHNDKQQDVISFAFPLDLTEEELRANAGEPTDFKEYKDGDYVSHTLEYTRESTMYYGDWGYDFEFINGELQYLTLDWLP